jgi:F0F1-type ATP synthase membrane subunit b/b'
MDILRSLGVDWTLFVHLACFGISYVFLTKFILKPYLAAHREREKRTIGNEDMALRLVEEATKLQSRYENEARTLNHKIKGYYDESRAQAVAQYERLVSSARADANQVTKATQTEIEKEVSNAKKALVSEIPAVSAAIATQLAGKEISV